MKIDGFFDGSCWPNPHGKACYGFVIYSGGKKIKEGRGLIGNGHGMTNNVAECVALTELLGCILEEFQQATEVWIKGDSNIIIRQMNAHLRRRANKTAAGHYAKYLPAAHGRANVLRARCFVSFDWIPRENNSVADALADFGGF